MVVCDPKVNTSFHAAKGLVPIKVFLSGTNTYFFNKNIDDFD